jgi:hypothetical protein
VTWLAGGEAVALVVLGVFVLALVHSYAGLAARVDELTGARSPRGEPFVAPRDGAPSVRADVVAQVTGMSPAGEAAIIPLVGVERDTLLAFLTSTCTSCQRLWLELAEADGGVLPSSLRLLVMPKGPEHESPASILAAAPAGCDVVMSSTAWSDFHVPGSPYFVLVGAATGAVLGEGTALTWSRVVDLAAVATGDEHLASGVRRDPRKPADDLRREAAVDRILLDAGIAPGDPSLYPGRAAEVDR